MPGRKKCWSIVALVMTVTVALVGPVWSAEQAKKEQDRLQSQEQIQSQKQAQEQKRKRIESQTQEQKQQQIHKQQKGKKGSQSHAPGGKGRRGR